MHDFSDAPFAKTEPPAAIGDAHRIPLQFDAWMTNEPGWLLSLIHISEPTRPY